MSMRHEARPYGKLPGSFDFIRAFAGECPDFAQDDNSHWFSASPSSVASLHLVFHATRKLFNFFRFLDHLDGEHVLVRLVHVVFQFGRPA